MKISCSIDIEKPLEKVLELFEDSDNMKKWQDGFIRIDHQSSEPGQVGSKSRDYSYHEQNRFKGLYEHPHMVNTMDNRFTSIAENKTRWNVEVEYTRLNGFIPKLMALMMPGMFRKQVEKWLRQFKRFAERS